MKSVYFQAILSMFLTACSVETMNVGEGAKADVQTEEQSPAPKEEETDPEGTEDPEMIVKTTTTTETVVKVGGEESAPAEKSFRLSNKNQAIDKFVSENYCRGSNLRDCWLKSGTMKEVTGGWLVSLEFWETSNVDEPYKVIEATINTPQAMLLTTNAKIPGDESMDYRFLWAVVDPEKKTLDVVYDFAEDGPQGQGDETLQSFVFTEAAPK